MSKSRLDEVEEIQRATLARMDESDRKAEERKKQREEQREELRAKLGAAGLREVSSEELLATVKRVSDAVDEFLQRKELMGFLEEAVREICLPSALTGFEARIDPHYDASPNWNERDGLTQELDNLLQELSRPADHISPQGLGIGIPAKCGLIGKYVKEIRLHKTVPARERSIQIMPFGGAY